MSGIQRIANAIANDSSFAAKAGMNKATAAAFVGKGQAGGEDSMQHKAGKAISKPGK